MLKRFTYGTIPMPKLFIAENEVDAKTARDAGLPYLIWKDSEEELMRTVLMPTMRKLFPAVAVKSSVKTVTIFEPVVRKTEYVPYDEDATGIAVQGAARYDENDTVVSDFDYKIKNIDKYMGSFQESVVLDALQDLGMLPSFVGDIKDCIQKNLQSNLWSEGWNKKKRSPIGKFEAAGELPNLILIDVSASIPKGISATMIALAETLCSRCNAELIIHSDNAIWYGVGDQLPKRSEVRNKFGMCNGSYEFGKVLLEHVSGREFGNVIAFGDFDSFSTYKAGLPKNWEDKWEKPVIHHLWNFHTCVNDRCGFVNWADPIEESFNNTWTQGIDWWY